jgi:hypothetical protein
LERVDGGALVASAWDEGWWEGWLRLGVQGLEDLGGFLGFGWLWYDSWDGFLGLGWFLDWLGYGFSVFECVMIFSNEQITLKDVLLE